MSLEVPDVDDLAYEELMQRAKTLVSAHSDEWTDFNPHDPGITILELLAWLTETHSYELDQITDAHRNKYLSLVGATPAPPQPASVRLKLSPAPRQAGRLPAGTRLTADDGSGTTAEFTTDHARTLTDATLAAVVVDHGHSIQPKTEANATDGIRYRPFGDEPTPGSALALGFDGDPFDGGEELSLFVDFHEGDLPAPATAETEPKTFEPSVRLVWEYCRGYSSSDESTAWEPLAVRSDTTDSLYTSGFVTLGRPEPWEPTQWASAQGCFGHDPGLVWLRCRVERGGYEIPPQFNTIELNVIEASHRHHHESTLEPTPAASGGSATRIHQLDHAPVLSATVTVDGTEWTEVEDFDASGPAGRHYVLDRQRGELTFGDAERGRRPPADGEIRVSYVAGGGTAGNVPETANWWFSDTDQPLGDGTLSQIDVSPTAAATGGRDAEAIADAVDRHKRDLQTPHRAVTKADYAAIADRTPGLRIARTTVRLPDEHPSQSPISVVVVPYAPPDVSQPTPSEGFRAAVQRQLDSHRLLTDRVTVDAPSYADLHISVSVTPTTSSATGAARSAIESHLQAYLDPIRGFEGEGWPFGRPLSTAELETQVRSLPTVDDVGTLSVRTVGDGAVGADGTVRIDDGTLFSIPTVDVTLRESPALGGR